MMAFSFFYVMAVAGGAIAVMRRANNSRLSLAISFSFTPLTLLPFVYLVLPAYWNFTIGTLQDPSDDGRGFGTVFALLVAIPTTLIANLIVFFARPERAQHNPREASS